jgi:hypothetical protein
MPSILMYPSLLLETLKFWNATATTFAECGMVFVEGSNDGVCCNWRIHKVYCLLASSNISLLMNVFCCH